MSAEPLARRFEGIEGRLQCLERMVAVFERLDALLQRISNLEQRAYVIPPGAVTEPVAQPSLEDGPTCTTGATSSAQASSSFSGPSPQSPTSQPQLPSTTQITVTPNASSTQHKLELEMIAKGFSEAQFIRVAADYYDWPLEARQAVLRAHSTHHLCKTMIMENTKAHPSVNGWNDPRNSKYYLVIVQYTAKQHNEKIKAFLHKLNEGRIGKQYFNLRVAPMEVGLELSGFAYNAVTPIAIKTQLPILMSDRIAQLDPDFFWLGAGETDLKVGLHAREFIKVYQPFVMDCTY